MYMNYSFGKDCLLLIRFAWSKLGCSPCKIKQALRALGLAWVQELVLVPGLVLAPALELALALE